MKAQFILLFVCLVISIQSKSQDQIIGIVLDSKINLAAKCEVPTVNGVKIKKVIVYGTKEQIMKYIIGGIVAKNNMCTDALKSAEQRFQSLPKVDKPNPPCPPGNKTLCMYFENSNDFFDVINSYSNRNDCTVKACFSYGKETEASASLECGGLSLEFSTSGKITVEAAKGSQSHSLSFGGK